MTDPVLAGLKPGDLVAIAVPPSEAWIPLVHGIWSAGAAMFPLDNRLPPAAANNLLQRVRPTLLVTRSGAERRGGGQPTSSSTAAVVATSGTTGTPRMVELTRDAITSAITASAAVLGAGADEAWLCCIPVAHIGGLLVLLRHEVLGAPVEVQSGFSIEAVRNANRARFVSLVPTQLRRLFEAGVDCTRWRASLVGGGAFPLDLAREAAERGVNAVATYGLTESCGGVVYNGRPLPGSEMRTAAAEAHIAPPGVRVATGDEVQIKGPTLMSGYRFDAMATASAFTADGWLHTRDSGSIANGVLTVHGRLDDVIVTGGEKVWPQQIEQVLTSHALVQEVAVHGVPDAEWGERVVAVVVPRNRDAPPTVEALREHVAERLPRHMAPREIIIVDALARTPLGKVRRDVLSR
jgi:O-succinylbenzoic acid--CoA ligase